MSSLRFYHGTMGAAKSASLLIQRHNYTEKNIGNILITPHRDNRFGIGKVKSRVGIEAEADIVIKEEESLLNKVEKIVQDNELLMKRKIKIIFVEEVQFFTSAQIDQLAYIVDNLNISVYCYGLKDDFQTHLFPGSKRLIELADSLYEIENLCHCGEKATCNMRVNNGKKVEEGEQVEIDNNNNINYVSVCRKCWTLGKF